MQGRFYLKIFVALGIIVYPVSAIAQKTDLDTILEAIKGVGKKVDDLQQRVEKLEGDVEQAGDDSPIMRTRKTKSVKRKRRAEYVPGWKVGVRPSALNPSDPREPVGFFIQPKISPIPYRGWEPFIGKQTPAVIEGEGILFVDEPGKYGFQLRLMSEAPERYYSKCLQVRLHVNDKNLITIVGNTNQNDYFSSKSMKLREGKYFIKFKIGWSCKNAWGERYYQPIQLGIKMLEPGSTAPRNLTSNDIYHIKR